MGNPKSSAAGPGTTDPRASALPPLKLGALATIGAPAQCSTPPSRAKAPAPVPSAPEPIAAPSKREPSLLVLSRQIMNAVQRPVRAGRLKPPPPPRSDRKVYSAEEQQRRAADATSYNVQTSSMLPPRLTTSPSAENAWVVSEAASWEAEVASLTKRKGRSLTLFLALGGVACCVLVFYFR